MRSHGALLRGAPLELFIANSFAARASSDRSLKHVASQMATLPARFAVSCRANDSLWEVRERIAAVIPLPPDQLQLVAGGRDLDLSLSSRSLGELRLTDQQVVQCSKTVRKSCLRSVAMRTLRMFCSDD